MPLEAAHRQASDTAGLVQRLADRVRPFGALVGRDRSGFDNLAAAVDELATLARTAARSIDQALALARECAHKGEGTDLTISLYQLAAKWTVSLENALDAAVAIYAQACKQLADRVSVAEEHHADSTPPEVGGLTAATLGRHARALEKTCSSAA